MSCATIRKLSMQNLMGLLRFGMPWRTFWGYINGYSERLQIVISTKEKISRNIKQVCKFHKIIKCRFTITTFIFLI